jgi:hypothetical protein
MADVKISARAAASLPYVGSEVIPLIVGGSDRKGYLGGMAAVVTPEHYGCVGDGVTDDTTNFQACLTAGHKAVFAKNKYKITTTLQLATNQILFGLPKGMVAETFVAGTTPGIDYQGAANTVAIKNAASAQNCGVQDMGIHLNDNGSTGIQFSATYGNIARRVHFYGTMRIGLLANDTYTCDFDALVFNGASVRTACVFLGTSNNTTIRSAHISALPNTVGECQYGIALSDSGNGNAIRDCAIQGPTIGIAGSAAGFTEICNSYFENTLCDMRLGNLGSSQGKYHVTGGTLTAPDASHSQYAKRGPIVILACNTATFVGPAVEIAAANADALGPWPFVLDSCGAFQLTNPFHYNGAAATYARDMIYRRTAGANTGITIIGSDYSAGTHRAQEIVLKNSGAYGSLCHGIRVDNAGAITAVAYQPAIIFADIDALLRTNLPTGASLVIA